MGYRKIQNLYRDIRILEFKECYALEKIHGTSAHVRFNGGKLTFFSGGSKHESFVELFDSNLLSRFCELGMDDVCVYGEASGGKLQRMRDTYGDVLRFDAFEVKIGDDWLTVPKAEAVVEKLGLEFVAWERGPATEEWINSQRDADSSLAKKLGLGVRMREGVVVRPIEECRDYRKNRIITKHKRSEFSETKTKRVLDPEKLKVLSEANEVAEEWVTDMRMTHVLDKLNFNFAPEHTGLVIKAMVLDIQEEGEGEIVWSKAVGSAIARATAVKYKKATSKLEGEVEQ